jgi:hypothetical protein
MGMVGEVGVSGRVSTASGRKAGGVLVTGPAAGVVGWAVRWIPDGVGNEIAD